MNGKCVDHAIITKGRHVVELIEAIRQANEPGVTMCLQKGAKINAFSRGGATPLYEATTKYSIEYDSQDSLNILHLLITAGANIELGDRRGRTALMVACELGNDKAAKLLVEHGARLDSEAQDGMTALKMAVSCGPQMVIDILRLGADPNQKTANGFTALDSSFHLYQHGSTVELLKNGARPELAQSNNGKNARMFQLWTSIEAPSLYAVDIGDIAALQALLEAGNPTDIRKRDDSKNPLLLTAARSGNLNVVELLLKYNADVNIVAPSGLSPLIAAIIGRKYDVILALVSSGADIAYGAGKAGWNSLTYGAASGNANIVELILRTAQARGTELEMTEAINVASSKRHQDVLRLLHNAQS